MCIGLLKVIFYKNVKVTKHYFFYLRSYKQYETPKNYLLSTDNYEVKKNG